MLPPRLEPMRSDVDSNTIDTRGRKLRRNLR